MTAHSASADLVALTLVSNPRIKEIWHAFSHALLVGESGLVKLTPHFGQQVLIESGGIIHNACAKHGSATPASMTAMRRALLDVSKTAPQRLHILRVAEWHLEQAGDAATRAAAASFTMTDSDKFADDALTTIVEAAEAYAHAAVATATAQTIGTSGCPAELFERLDAIEDRARSSATSRLRYELEELAR